MALVTPHLTTQEMAFQRFLSHSGIRLVQPRVSDHQQGFLRTVEEGIDVILIKTSEIADWCCALGSNRCSNWH